MWGCEGKPAHIKRLGLKPHALVPVFPVIPPELSCPGCFSSSRLLAFYHW